MSHKIGTLEVGKMADIVLWDPAMFGAKPRLVLKSGFPAWVWTSLSATTFTVGLG